MKFLLASILSFYFSTVVGWNFILATIVMFSLVYVFDMLANKGGKDANA